MFVETDLKIQYGSNRRAMKNLLVTGGAGFIGSNFVHFVLDKHPDIFVVNLDLLTYAGNLESIKELLNLPNHKFIKGNICDEFLTRNIIDQYEIDTIVHFAAETHVDRSIQSPVKFINTNIYGTFSLLEAVRKSKNVRFHHISTDEVFGELPAYAPAFHEKTPYSPNSPYSATKASSDHLVNAYGQTYGLQITITNCANNYGAYQFPEKLIPVMILNALEGKPLPIYGNGKNIRDWIHVDDHCEAIWKVLEKGYIGERYNIGGDNQYTNLEVVDMICDILEELRPESVFRPFSALKKFVPDRPGHDYRYAMNINKIKSELDWQPRYTLLDGLYKTVRWYLNHMDWIDTIRSSTDYQDWMKTNYSDRKERTE